MPAGRRPAEGLLVKGSLSQGLRHGSGSGKDTGGTQLQLEANPISHLGETTAVENGWNVGG